MYRYRRSSREVLELETRKSERESVVGWQVVILPIAGVLEGLFEMQGGQDDVGHANCWEG